MNNLIALIEAATEDKPKMGERCNNCGWCCLTEVCSVGKKLVGEVIPCKLLIEEDGKHYCNLMRLDVPDIASALAIGSGCDAQTQQEAMEKYL